MPPPFPPLYAILDIAAIDSQSTIPEALSESGVCLIQLRDKHASARAIFTASKNLLARLLGKGARIIVNDRADIAAMVGAGGVHVGLNDLPVDEVRAVCGSDRWVGVSTHNLEQLQLASRTSADYIAVGPIFPTTTKENPDPVVGLELLREAKRLTRKPIVAIGGITVKSAESVYRAGADSVAIVSDLLSTADPAQRSREYLAIAERVLAGGELPQRGSSD